MACILPLARFHVQNCPSKHERVYASTPSPFHMNINGPSSNYIAKKPRATNRLTMTTFFSIASLPQQLTRMSRLTTQVATIVGDPEPWNPLVKLMIEYFYLGGKPFFGTESAIEAQDWLNTCERIFQDLNLEDPIMQSKLAIRELRGRAMRWWNDNFPPDPIEWDMFKTRFEGKYITEVQKSVLFRKFADLRQGGMSVSEYVAEFEMLSKYGESLIDPPAKKREKFVIGLDDPLREMLLNHIGTGETATYDMLVEKALRYESLYPKPKSVLASKEEQKPQVRGEENNNNNKRKQLFITAG